MLGLILSPMLEMSLGQSLAMSGGSYAIFMQRPIALAMLIGVLALWALSLRDALATRRGRADWRTGAGLGRVEE